MTSASSGPSVYPTLSYADAPAAIEFLMRAFGLVHEMRFDNPDGTVAHAELSWGNGIVMLNSRKNPPSEFQPGRSAVYLAVDNTDAHHARAVAEGAEIIMPPTDMDYGSREYAARDHEGNVWSFGTYRPTPK
jgi:uncharacterized glyoxalase superfamily protein PhnB